MHVDIAGQAAVFGQALLLGALLGLVYDAMRTLRRTWRSAGLAFALDLLFWLGATAALFLLTLSRDDGRVRIFHMAAVALGGGFCPRRSESDRAVWPLRSVTRSARSGQRGSLEQSEGESPAAAQRGRVLPEAERKRPSGLAALKRDKKRAGCAKIQYIRRGKKEIYGD